MVRTTLAALAVAALALAPAPALADPGDGGPRHHGLGFGGVEAWSNMADRHMAHLMDKLKLTPDQRGKVETIRARHHEAMKPVREELMKKRQALFELVRSAKGTKDQAIARQREIDVLQARLAEARLAAWFEARAVLTPEQLAQLEKLPAGREGRRHKRWRGQDR